MRLEMRDGAAVDADAERARNTAAPQHPSARDRLDKARAAPGKMTCRGADRPAGRFNPYGLVKTRCSRRRSVLRTRRGRPRRRRNPQAWRHTSEPEESNRSASRDQGQCRFDEDNLSRHVESRERPPISQPDGAAHEHCALILQKPNEFKELRAHPHIRSNRAAAIYLPPFKMPAERYCNSHERT